MADAMLLKSDHLNVKHQCSASALLCARDGFDNTFSCLLHTSSQRPMVATEPGFPFACCQQNKNKR